MAELKRPRNNNYLKSKIFRIIVIYHISVSLYVCWVIYLFIIFMLFYWTSIRCMYLCLQHCYLTTAKVQVPCKFSSFSILLSHSWINLWRLIIHKKYKLTFFNITWKEWSICFHRLKYRYVWSDFYSEENLFHWNSVFFWVKYFIGMVVPPFWIINSFSKPNNESNDYSFTGSDMDAS